MQTVALDSAVRVAKALAHPTRLRIAAMLDRGPLCVCQLTALFEAASSTISAHLLELRRAGVVRETKQGKWVEYRLHDEAAVLGVLTPLLAIANQDDLLAADLARLREVTSIPAAVLCEAGLDVTRALKAARRRPPTTRPRAAAGLRA
jgi:ArsR family transcriptional regulator, arsenate/arsenite/antimonite-responsive transcriptional repressor